MMTIKGLGIRPLDVSDQGLPSVDTGVLKQLSKNYA